MSPRDQDSDEARPATRPTPEELRRPRPGDACGCGSTRLASGRCAETGEWPRYVWRMDPTQSAERFTLSVPCPYACPICGASLAWDGGCEQCHGSVTSWERDTWTFPGDRYEREGHHWVTVDGPRPACSPEANHAAFKELRWLLDLVGAADRSRGSRRLGLPAVDPAIRDRLQGPLP